jgi:hypothetical protein
MGELFVKINLPGNFLVLNDALVMSDLCNVGPLLRTGLMLLVATAVSGTAAVIIVMLVTYCPHDLRRANLRFQCAKYCVGQLSPQGHQEGARDLLGNEYLLNFAGPGWSMWNICKIHVN